MHAAQTDMSNVIDFSAVLTGVGGRAMCRKRMTQYIHGIRGPRQNPVSFKQIRIWFRATPEDFLHDILVNLMAEDIIRIVQTNLSRKRPAYRYELKTT